jgi:arylsulfatase
MHATPALERAGHRRLLPGDHLSKSATLILTIVAGGWSALPGEQAYAADARSLPNIVLILADDLGFSDLGCYGSEMLTPNLDRLARGGLRFTQFYNCGRCCPTRAALLTGLYPHQAGVGHMMDDFRRPGYRGNLNRECATIAEVLKTGGYQTMMVGKWHVTRHNGPEGPKFNWPISRGFEKFYGTIHGAGSYFDPISLCRDDHFVHEGSETYYYTDALSDQAVQYIEGASRAGKPFFLYVAYTAPHWPLHAPKDVLARYRGKYAAGWDALRKERYDRMISMGLIKRTWPLTPREPSVRPWELNQLKPWQQQRMEVYAAQVDVMDRGIGRIVDRLQKLGLERNTLLMFLADNGGCAEEVSETWTGPHIPAKTPSGRAVLAGNNPNIPPGGADTYQSYGIAWANASNTPFRLYKHFVHEGGIATPLIVSWPSMIRSGGSLIHEPGHVIDILPTCLDVAKLPYPRNLGGYSLAPVAGQSLLPLWQGQKRPPRPLYWEHEGNRAVRDGKWKLVARHAGPWELYDIEADRTEMNDLAAKFPAIVKDLVQQYDAWAKRSNVEPWNAGK